MGSACSRQQPSEISGILEHIRCVLACCRGQVTIYKNTDNEDELDGEGNEEKNSENVLYEEIPSNNTYLSPMDRMWKTTK